VLECGKRGSLRMQKSGRNWKSVGFAWIFMVPEVGLEPT
jgi:hypothetical protein